MTTRLESELRDGLHALANQPGPPSLADKALVGARRTRRLRVVLATVGVLAFAGAISGPVLAGAGTPPDASAGARNGGCGTATDESNPAKGVPRADWPEFVTIVVDGLPPRSDYTLQSAYGVCTLPDAVNPARPSAYAVINLGPEREFGHLTVDLLYGATSVPTCATLPTAGEPLFCDDATAGSPMVFGLEESGLTIVTAVYPDARTVSIGSHDTPLDAEALRPVVTDPFLAGLLS